jgi:hypothetical protein
MSRSVPVEPQNTGNIGEFNLVAEAPMIELRRYTRPDARRQNVSGLIVAARSPAIHWMSSLQEQALSGKPKGRLVIIGGHEEKQGDEAILKAVVQRARGERGHLAIVTVATQEPEEVGREYRALFCDLPAILWPR